MSEAIFNIFVENDYIDGLGTSGDNSISFILKGGTSIDLPGSLEYTPSEIGYSWDPDTAEIHVVWYYNDSKITSVSVESFGGTETASLSVQQDHGYTARLHYCTDGIMFNGNDEQLPEERVESVYYSLSSSTSQALSFSYGNASDAVYKKEVSNSTEYIPLTFYYINSWYIEDTEDTITSLSSDLEEYADEDGYIDLYPIWKPTVTLPVDSYLYGGEVTMGTDTFVNRSIRPEGGDGENYYVGILKNESSTISLPMWEYALGSPYPLGVSTVVNYAVVRQTGWVLYSNSGNAISDPTSTIGLEAIEKLASGEAELHPYGSSLLEGAHILYQNYDYCIPAGNDLFSECEIVSNSDGLCIETTSLSEIIYGYDPDSIILDVDVYSSPTVIPVNNQSLFFCTNETYLMSQFISNMTFESGKVYDISTYIQNSIGVQDFITDTHVDEENAFNVGISMNNLTCMDRYTDYTYNLSYLLQAKFSASESSSGSAITVTLGTVNLQNGNYSFDLDAISGMTCDWDYYDDDKIIIARFTFDNPDALLFDYKLKYPRE